MKILILGAGIYQTPLISRAVEAGHHVAAASFRPDDPGLEIAHDPWIVDTTDREALLAMAREKRIEAVATTGTDVAIPSIGFLCDSLGLPGVSHATALAATDKVVMRNTFMENNIKSAHFQVTGSLEETFEAVKTVGFPCMLKTPDKSGSKGIQVVVDENGVAGAYRIAARESNSGDVLVEEFLQGTEFGAQVVVSGGEVIACLSHNDTVTSPPVCVPVGHSLPCILPAPVQHEAEQVCARAVKALGIQNAVCNADLILCEDGVHIIEIAVRAGATGLPEIVLAHYGIDLYDLTLRFAAGERVSNLQRYSRRAAAVRILQAPDTGVLSRCYVPLELMMRKDVAQIVIDYKVGTSVHEFTVGQDRIGSVVTMAGSAREAERIAEEVTAMIDVEVT